MGEQRDRVGTREVGPIVAGTDPFGEPLPFSLTGFRGRAYFTASDPVHGQELWRSDGTAAGTGLARDIFPGLRGSNPGELTVSGGLLYFAAEDRAHGRELWAVSPGGSHQSGEPWERLPTEPVTLPLPADSRPVAAEVRTATVRREPAPVRRPLAATPSRRLRRVRPPRGPTGSSLASAKPQDP